MLLTASAKGTPLTPTEADANLTLLEDRTGDGWADIVSELFVRDSPTSPPVTLYRDGIYLYEFQKNDTLEVFANFHMPHSWRRNTMLYPHVHFVTTSNAAGTVRWGFEYTFARRHDSTGQTAFPATTTLIRTFDIAANNAHTHFVAEMPEGHGIPGAGLEVDAMILMRIFRESAHGTDTFPDSVFGITADLHIEVDRYATANRAPDFYA